MMGQKATSIMKNTITEWTEPPNAPSTVASKGYNDPLHDSGTMTRAVTYQVRYKNEKQQKKAMK